MNQRQGIDSVTKAAAGTAAGGADTHAPASTAGAAGKGARAAAASARDAGASPATAASAAAVPGAATTARRATDPTRDLGRRLDAHGDDLPSAQVFRRLEADILTGRLARGERLAPERELGIRLGVARNTLRRGLAMLAARGLVESRGRQGWIVTAPVTELVLGTQGLTDWAERQGFVATSRVLTARIRPARDLEATRLRIAVGSPVFELERVRLVDERPLSLDRSILHPRLAGELSAVDFSSASLYRTVRGCGVIPGRAEVVLRAIRADARAAELLDTDEGAALLEITETAFDQYGAPFEAATLVNRGDRYAFGTSLSAEAGAPRIEIETRV